MIRLRRDNRIQAAEIEIFETGARIFYEGGDSPKSIVPVIPTLAVFGIGVPHASRVLNVSRSGLYAWQVRVPSERAGVDAVLSEVIVRIHTDSRTSCGARRAHAELRLGLGVA